jgi:hypothetical protein
VLIAHCKNPSNNLDCMPEGDLRRIAGAMSMHWRLKGMEGFSQRINQLRGDSGILRQFIHFVHFVCFVSRRTYWDQLTASRRPYQSEVVGVRQSGLLPDHWYGGCWQVTTARYVVPVAGCC